LPFPDTDIAEAIQCLDEARHGFWFATAPWRTAASTPASSEIRLKAWLG